MTEKNNWARHFSSVNCVELQPFQCMCPDYKSTHGDRIGDENNMCKDLIECVFNDECIDHLDNVYLGDQNDWKIPLGVDFARKSLSDYSCVHLPHN